jgi:hypothetical protein
MTQLHIFQFPYKPLFSERTFRYQINGYELAPPTQVAVCPLYHGEEQVLRDRITWDSGESSCISQVCQCLAEAEAGTGSSNRRKRPVWRHHQSRMAITAVRQFLCTSIWPVYSRHRQNVLTLRDDTLTSDICHSTRVRWESCDSHRFKGLL